MNQVKALFLFILLACSLNITAQRIKGSDTVLPVSQETAEIFMKDDPDRRVTVTGGGTGVGISALMDNTTDIAMASRPIKFSEKMKLKAAKQEVEEVIIAYDALAATNTYSGATSKAVLIRQRNGPVQGSDAFCGSRTIAIKINCKKASVNSNPAAEMWREIALRPVNGRVMINIRVSNDTNGSNPVAINVNNF